MNSSKFGYSARSGGSAQVICVGASGVSPALPVQTALRLQTTGQQPRRVEAKPPPAPGKQRSGSAGRICRRSGERVCAECKCRLTRRRISKYILWESRLLGSPQDNKSSRASSRQFSQSQVSQLALISFTCS